MIHRKMELTLVVVLILPSLAASGCKSQQAAETQKPAPAAKVENAVKESDLATVTLSPEAEARLGIHTAPVEQTTVSRTRTFGGEVVLPPDSILIVAAPMAGTVHAGASGGAPSAGALVKKGQAIFRLLPFIAPERNMVAQAAKELADAKTRFEAGQVKLARAEQLLRDKAGSVRQVEQAREDLAVALSTLKTAQEKVEHMERAPHEADGTIVVVSPEDGMVQKVHAGTGQRVAASTPLFEIASLKSIWLRVPIYAGEVGSIDRRQPAKVHNLGHSPGSPIVSARPIAAPPTANANASTVDLYFELPSIGPFRPGQKVGVTLQLTGADEGLVVPNSAIVSDVHGGEWVYENIAPHQYVRRRVEVRNVTGSQAVLSRGPAAGTQVVVTGAAELFGTEFGTGK